MRLPEKQACEAHFPWGDPPENRLLLDALVRVGLGGCRGAEEGVMEMGAWGRELPRLFRRKVPGWSCRVRAHTRVCCETRWQQRAGPGWAADAPLLGTGGGYTLLFASGDISGHLDLTL